MQSAAQLAVKRAVLFAALAFAFFAVVLGISVLYSPAGRLGRERVYVVPVAVSGLVTSALVLAFRVQFLRDIIPGGRWFQWAWFLSIGMNVALFFWLSAVTCTTDLQRDGEQLRLACVASALACVNMVVTVRRMGTNPPSHFQAGGGRISTISARLTPIICWLILFSALAVTAIVILSAPETRSFGVLLETVMWLLWVSSWGPYR